MLLYVFETGTIRRRPAGKARLDEEEVLMQTTNDQQAEIVDEEYEIETIEQFIDTPVEPEGLKGGIEITEKLGKSLIERSETTVVWSDSLIDERFALFRVKVDGDIYYIFRDTNEKLAGGYYIKTTPDNAAEIVQEIVDDEYASDTRKPSADVQKVEQQNRRSGMFYFEDAMYFSQEQLIKGIVCEHYFPLYTEREVAKMVEEINTDGPARIASHCMRVSCWDPEEQYGIPPDEFLAGVDNAMQEFADGKRTFWSQIYH